MFLLPWFDCRFVWTPALPWRLREAPCLLRPQSQGNESCGKDLGTFEPIQQVCIVVQQQSLWSASWNASLRALFFEESYKYHSDIPRPLSSATQFKPLSISETSMYRPKLCESLSYNRQTETRSREVVDQSHPYGLWLPVKLEFLFAKMSNWNSNQEADLHSSTKCEALTVKAPNCPWTYLSHPPSVPFISTWPPPTQTSRIALHQLEWLQSSPQEIFYTFHYIPTYLNAF